MDTPALRYLSAAELDVCLPDVDARIDLAAKALIALGRAAAEMPPKIGVHPRPGALLHAMPAWLREDDIVGLKWVSAFPGNRERGLPAISGVIVLNDPDTGLPTWVMEAARITAVRTAAVSGVAIRVLRPREVERVAILGAGIQGRSHIDVVASLLPQAELVIYDRHADRAQALAEEASRDLGVRTSSIADAFEATRSAQVVVTAATLGASNQVMTPDWVAPGTLIVSIDFATYASATLARTARDFIVDDREQFLAYRSNGYFDGYPEPTSTLGELLDKPSQADAVTDSAPARGSAGADDRPVLVSHLGVGLADVVFADAIAHEANSRGLGVLLQR